LFMSLNVSTGETARFAGNPVCSGAVLESFPGI
jgi:hypothetical protein